MAEGSNNCRFYEQKFPEVDDLVMVNVKRIAEMGAYVSLLEYNNIEGMILLSELSRRRIRSISKLIRVGRQEVVVVLRVDKEKGYIDLSKRRVYSEDIVKCEEKFNKAKAVHSIMRHVAETCQKNLEELYINFGWPLYKKFGHAYDAFKLSITDPDTVLADFDLGEEIKDAFLKNIRRRLTPQPVKIRADVEVTCFQYDGIDAIKSALTAGQNIGTDDTPIKIKLVAPPLYVMITTSLEKDKGITALTQAIDVVKDAIETKKGSLTVKTAPRAVTERDDKLLNNLLEELERKRQEKDGDNETDEEDTGMGDLDVEEPGIAPVVAAKPAKKDKEGSEDDDDESESEEEPAPKPKKKSSKESDAKPKSSKKK